MKKISFFAIVSAFVFSSCGTVMLGVKKSVYLVDAPRDLTITKNNESMEIGNITLGSTSSRGNSTVYQYPGFRTKLKRLNDFEFQSGDKKAIVKIKAKRQFGLLILEGVFTFGAFTVIDLITGGDRKPVPKFIDVPAILEKKTPRKQEVLHKIAQRESGMR